MVMAIGLVEVFRWGRMDPWMGVGGRIVGKVWRNREFVWTGEEALRAVVKRVVRQSGGDHFLHQGELQLAPASRFVTIPVTSRAQPCCQAPT